MFLLESVPTDSVIIEAGIFDQSDPFTPPRRNVAAVVLVEVFTEKGCRHGEHREESCFKYSV